MVELRSFQQYLHDHIPISKAMGVEVVEATVHGVRLSAPLSPNINHRETVFGGSAAAVAILSSWSLLHLRLSHQNRNGRIVIQTSTMACDSPITDIFTASSAVRDPAAWERFVTALERKNRARIRVNAVLHCNDRRVGEFEGDFVALILPKV
jgi:thioesterase domain-containing protein